jgi:acyl dehydratase
MMTTEALSLAKIQAFVGRELGASRWMTLDQHRIDEFAGCTGDGQWIHVDVERARRESPLGTTIAHGYLTLALIAPSTFEVLVGPAGIAQALNYGLDRVRFLAPVKAGARVRNRIKLLAAEAKGAGRFLLTTENTIEIENEAKPALIAQVLVLAIADSPPPPTPGEAP